MAQFGWAYINCSGAADGAGAGPTGSLQFISGSGGHTTGSHNLIYYTASYGEHTEPSTLVLSGNMIITGTISASVYNYQDIAVIDATGSTYFGNTNDDSHFRTGSLVVTKAGVSPSQYTLSASVSQRVYVRGFSGRYRQVNGNSNLSTDDYMIGCSGSGNQTLHLPSASTIGAGALLMIKDEYNNRGAGGGGASNITISASGPGAGGFQVDDESTYILTGSMPAVNLYSNGTDWFVF
jgi:hypothetical protein